MTKSWVRKATLLFFPFSFCFKKGKDWAEEETFDPRKVVRRDGGIVVHAFKTGNPAELQPRASSFGTVSAVAPEMSVGRHLSEQANKHTVQYSVLLEKN
jgi:hypothetical protein